MPTTYAIPNGRTVFDASLWTGNSVSGTNISGLNFQPDFVWLKSRTSADFHRLQNTNVGINKLLFSNATNAEQTNEVNGYVSAVTSNGYTLTAGSSGISGVNSTGNTYVGWSWLASPTTASNTAGTITSTVSANTTAGFSIVTYTGTGSTGTVGHGLGVAPKMIISKNRSAAENWRVAHIGLTNMASWHLNLDTTQAQTNSGAAIWNNTTPTSTIFGVGTDTSVSGNGNLIVAYCFAEVAGYSAFGSYTGNGSSDGPFIYTGFRPKFVMLKQYSGAGDNWHMMDTSRDTYNAAGLLLNANLANATNDARPVIDILSNGFKLRNTYSSINGSGSSYIYVCFAENPFKYANAR